ncbi:dynamin family protein [Aliiruegeria lutimaris]|uniref:Dynamin family protein n=1 Tax=Aliiruegeria lutimaris TaxID=571298 RepID=A0A1G8VXZ5_9RHOB|nr:dynamin family protein [Aliiruegeria lutimaris]SDJ70673.1 Dynamin family protein [Aliiruegeria lutimaris]
MLGKTATLDDGPATGRIEAFPSHGCETAEADPLVRMCLEGLSPLLAQRGEVSSVLETLCATADRKTAEAVERLRHSLFSLEPAVTFIGQVKAGKTSLVNAMIGEPGLLPADVNPWTSVVTSLHLGPSAEAAPYAARFAFFDTEDWDRLTRRGGRLGELAGRSGAEEEAEKVRLQIEAMRDKTRRRLGRKFELLLGTSHNYATLTRGLVERYVCLGDDFEEQSPLPGAEAQGRFADITKAADLQIARPGWPMNLCLRDTPGVNDTFMMREQITIGAIRDSRLCLVVLSAHQALSTVDMALIRLISNVQSREVVIFVNRIDELADPVRQIVEIRDSIRATLESHHGPKDAKIVFGIAHWATLALKGDLSALDEVASAVLLGYAEHVADSMERELGPLELIWWLSGVPELYSTIWNRVTEGAARERICFVARDSMNLAVGLSAAIANNPAHLASEHGKPIDVNGMQIALSALEARLLPELDRALTTALESASQRLERSHRSFLNRATMALVQHLESYGELAPWKYDPTGLRLLLRSGFQVFSRQVKDAGTQAAELAAEEISGIYAAALQRPASDFTIQPPDMPRIAPPVLIGQTIALDLKGNWWRRWWSRRRGYKAFAPEFHAMIDAETRPILDGLLNAHCQPCIVEVRCVLKDLLDEQRAILATLESHGSEFTGASEQVGPTPEVVADAVTRLGPFVV